MPCAALTHFYGVTRPRLADIMAYLDGFGFGGNALPPAEARLFRLALGLVEAAQAIEFFSAARLPGAPYPHDVVVGGRAGLSDRSEEHTSELQSLMRISYAVFCLKKKKNTNTTTTQIQ